METEHRRTIGSLLASTDPDQLRRGLDMIRDEITRHGSEDARPLFEMVSTVFYIDPLDRPDLRSVIDEAIALVVGFGEWVIPALVQNLDDGDIKAQLAIASALGRFGADAIGPLLAEYEAATDPAIKTFILYALGHVDSPKVVQAASITLTAARSDDRGLRDTAARAMGRIAAAVPAGELATDVRDGFVEELRTGLADTNAGIRAKAVRSLGKLARHGHLEADEKKQLQTALNRIIGTDEVYDWDRAYVVRKEAEEALRYI
ncbi:MAG: HEAT repeat domain-containing protein [bacterium]